MHRASGALLIAGVAVLLWLLDQSLASPEGFEQARQALTEQGGVPRTQQFAIGYCFGGAVVLGQARSGADLAGVASFHGSLGS